MKKVILGLGSLVLIGMLSGCFDKTPKCSDKAVQNILDKIFKQNIFPRLGLSKTQINSISISYGGFMTEEVDKDRNLVTCKAEVTYALDGKKESEWFYYTARPTDNGKEIYVEILSEE